MKDGTNWSNLLPASANAPREVARALKQVLDLRARVPEQARVVQEAKEGAAAAARDDERQMAQALRANRKPVSALDKVEQAKAKLDAEERTQRALEVAVSESEAALGEEIAQARDEWAKAAAARAAKAQDTARDALDTLTLALATLQSERATLYWLNDGLDRGVPVKVGGTAGYSPSSARFTANSAPLDVDQLLAFVAEIITPPEPATRADVVEHAPPAWASVRE